MKREISMVVLALMIGAGSMPLAALAVEDQALVIRAVYFGSPSDASDEYVIVHNNSNDAMQLQNLQIEYKSATGKSWVKRAVIDKEFVVGPHGDVVFATRRDHDFELGDGFAQAGGNIHLILGDQVYDQFAWGTGDSPEGLAMLASGVGHAVERSCDNTTGVCADSDDNSKDFRDKTIVTTATNSAAVSPGRGSDDSNFAEEYAVEITELLPDPASPQTDSKDEFVELYNAGTTTANLAGWKLTDRKHSYKLDGVSIPAGSYVALYARDTKLSLNNSGDQIAIVRPNGETAFIAPNYGKARVGKAFGATNDGWGWLELATPGGANSPLMQNSVDSDSASTKAKSKNAKTSKTSKAKSASAKSGALAKSNQDGHGSDMAAAEDRPVTPWAWILAGLGTLTVGYGAYEYRPEILSFFTKLRAKLGAGK